MKNNNIKITLDKILFSKCFSFIYFILMFLTFCYIESSTIKSIIQYSNIVISIAIIFMYILNLRFSKFTVLITIFNIGLILGTLLGENASFYLYFKTYYKFIALSYYIDWMIKNNSKNLISSLYWALYIIVTLNFISIILYPNGLYTASYSNNWFVGYDNTHIFWYMPTLILSLLHLKLKNKKIGIDTIFLVGSITYCVYYCFSANSVVAYTLFLAFLIFNKAFSKIKFMNSKTYFWLFIIIFFMIVIFRVQNIFSWLIVDILHKDLTFTNRTFIWDNAIESIQQNIIFGYGIEQPDSIASKFGNAHFVHAHNTILDVLYKGGIMACVPFIYLIYETLIKLNIFEKNKIIKIYSFLIFCLLVMMIFEAREDVIGFYITFSIAFNIEYVVKELEKNSERRIT